MAFSRIFDFNKEIFIICRKSYEIHFRGKFFLRDGFGLFLEIYEKIVSLGYTPHLSRVDVCFTGEWEFQELSRSLLKSDFKSMEVDSKKKKKKLTYVKAHNVRFEFLCYSKSAHLNRIKDTEYITGFRERYGNGKDISRMEVRLHNLYNLEKLTTLLKDNPSMFFKNALDEIPIHIQGRMRLTGRIKKVIVIALDELKKSL